MLAVIPLVAILPILLYIGLVIGAQAFQAVPLRHAPAVILAILLSCGLDWRRGSDGETHSSLWRRYSLFKPFAKLRASHLRTSIRPDGQNNTALHIV